MFLCHFLKTHVCSNNNAAKVRGKPCKSVNGCFEVLFVTTEVDQRDDFVTIIDNLFPVFVLVLVEPFRDHLFALLGEAQNFLTDWAGPPWLLFVEIVKDTNSCPSVSIVRDTFGKDWDKSGLSCVNITYDAYLEVLFRPFILLHHCELSNQYKRIANCFLISNTQVQIYLQTCSFPAQRSSTITNLAFFQLRSQCCWRKREDGWSMKVRKVLESARTSLYQNDIF